MILHLLPTTPRLRSVPRTPSLFACAVLAALALGGCRRAEPPPAVPRDAAAVVVLPAALELRAGEAVQLVVQVNDAAGQPLGGAQIEFVSDSRELVEVTRDGLVTATGPVGTGQLRVASGRAESRVPVTVVAARPQTLALPQPQPQPLPAPAPATAAAAPDAAAP